MEDDLKHNNSRVEHLIEVKEQKDLDYAECLNRIQNEDDKIAVMAREIKDLDMDLAYVEGQNDKHKEC